MTWDNVYEINYLSHSWNENTWDKCPYNNGIINRTHNANLIEDTWDKLIFYFLKWKKSAIVAVRSRALVQACAMQQCQMGLFKIPLEISVICGHKKLMWSI